MRAIVLGPEGRLRAGWRVLLQAAGFLVLVVANQTLGDAAVAGHSVATSLLASAVYFLGQMLLLWALARWVDRRRFADLGLRLGREWWLDLLVGLAVGAFTMAAVSVVARALGWVSFTMAPQTPFSGPLVLTVVAVLLRFVAVGLGEESTFRGYQGRNLAEWARGGLGAKRAVAAAAVVTSVVFGVAHLANPNSTLLSAACVTAAGLVLGLAWMLSGTLALPLGMHVTWGYFEEFVCGYANSGQAPVASLLQNAVTGPSAWMGGRFGPESGLLMLCVEVVDVALIVLWLRYRRRLTGIRANLAEYTRR